MKRHRIGMITTSYPHAGDRVAGNFVRDMALALAARGHEVRVVCVGRRDRAGWDAPLRDPGVQVTAARYHPAETFYGGGAPDRLASLAWRSWAGGVVVVPVMLAVARRVFEDVDGIVSHFILPCGAVGGMLRAGRPHVAVVHGTDGWLLARCPRAAQRAVLRGATHLWFTHDALRARLVDAGVAYSVRPMGVAVPAQPDPHVAHTDLPPPSPLSPSGEGGVRAFGNRDRTPPSPDGERGDGGGRSERAAGTISRKLVVAVGRLVPVKRVDRAVRAVAALVREGCDVELVVLGDGPERSSLEALSAREAPGRVRWMGAVDARVRDEWLARADVFLHTAGTLKDGRSEGAPVSVLEAMASGVAVVATDAGGVREVVGDAGVVVGDGHDEAVVDALRRVLDDDDGLRVELARRARERAWRWRWESQVELLERELFGG